MINDFINYMENIVITCLLDPHWEFCTIAHNYLSK